MAEKEYIDRIPFIRALSAMESEYYAVRLDGMIKSLKEATVADVAEVVRCKNCVRSQIIFDILGNPRLFCTYWRGNPEVEFDDFCSYGKRKEVTPC